MGYSDEISEGLLGCLRGSQDFDRSNLQMLKVEWMIKNSMAKAKGFRGPVLVKFHWRWLVGFKAKK